MKESIKKKKRVIRECSITEEENMLLSSDPGLSANPKKIKEKKEKVWATAISV